MTNAIIANARAEGRTLLNEVECKALLEEAGIRTARTQLATSADEAVRAAAVTGYPVVLKIVSPDIVHKTDVGGVALDLGDEAALRAAYDRMLAAVRSAEPQARIAGVAVQPMARPGIEVIIGMTKDAQFGPVLMFGLGGILVEVLKDVAFRLVPLEVRDARQMLREIKGFPLLQGYRGQEPADLAALERLLLAVSRFVEEHPEIDELDLNPVLAYRDGALAVDARAVLAAQEVVP